ncbi:MAG TPA: S8 family serine peptidase [Polyangiaceae bacterium]
MLRLRLAPLAALALFFASSEAIAGGHPSGAALVRLLGPHAGIALSSTGRDDTLDALVPLPDGAAASTLGLEPVVPGFGRLRGGAPAFLAFERAHPDLPIDVAPPLHMLLDRAGLFTHATVAHSASENGSGVLVGVADTGLDVTHADFLDASGRTRVAWLLDLSAPPYGKYPDLEQKYGVVDANGVLVQGAVYAAADLDQLAGTGVPPPSDSIGHGTHVTSIAAGNGGPVTAGPHYVGFAPQATILFARVTRDSTGSIDNGDLVRSVQFLFDRADAMALPVAVNLSLGTDFGPHDGTMDWEQVLASYVGPAHPGHALVAAAGNSGSIYDTPVHQSVRVSPGARMTVPIQTHGATSGSLEVWVAIRSGASLSVGFAGPDGEWIAPVSDGNEAGKNTSQYNAGVINGSSASKSPVPAASHGAVAVVSGRWPSGTYAIELDGVGTADLYLEGTGDVSVGESAGFATAVREGTINLPATHPSILGVGCTVNKPTWTTLTGALESQSAPVLDGAGGEVLLDASGEVESRPLADGEACWF